MSQIGRGTLFIEALINEYPGINGASAIRQMLGEIRQAGLNIPVGIFTRNKIIAAAYAIRQASVVDDPRFAHDLLFVIGQLSLREIAEFINPLITLRERTTQLAAQFRRTNRHLANRTALREDFYVEEAAAGSAQLVPARHQRAR